MSISNQIHHLDEQSLETFQNTGSAQHTCIRIPKIDGLLLYPPYPKDRGMLWFYVEAARHPPPAMVLTR